MAKIKLSESTFTLIPEGTTTFKITEVDDTKYDDFGKLAVKMVTADGQVHTERFSLVNGKGELNEGALKAWSYFARTCLNNFNADEIDTQDIVGCFLTATVKHETYNYTNKEGEQKTGTSVRLNDYTTASGFTHTPTTSKSDESAEDDLEDLDDLDDLDDFLNE